MMVRFRHALWVSALLLVCDPSAVLGPHRGTRLAGASRNRGFDKKFERKDIEINETTETKKRSNKKTEQVNLKELDKYSKQMKKESDKIMRHLQESLDKQMETEPKEVKGSEGASSRSAQTSHIRHKLQGKGKKRGSEHDGDKRRSKNSGNDTNNKRSKNSGNDTSTKRRSKGGDKRRSKNSGNDTSTKRRSKNSGNDTSTKRRSKNSDRNKRKESNRKKRVGADTAGTFLDLGPATAAGVAPAKEPRVVTDPTEEKKCTKDGEHCLEDMVTPFVDLMRNINKEYIVSEQKKKPKVDISNVYDNENHTVTVFDEENKDVDLYKKYDKKKNVKDMRTQVIEGSEYLGAGYDFIFGNPVGDPFLNVDPGYRDAIIKLTYPKSDNDYPANYTNVNPNGSYIRNEISCNRSEKDTEISSLSEYTKELSVDASVSVSYFAFAKFSASAGYKSASTAISKNKSKLFILKSYCFKYVASLSQYSQWKLTDQFARATHLLPSHFNSLEFDEKFCLPKDMNGTKEKKDLCGASVHAWISFFKNFGTHVSTVIHLGGKITQTMKISRSEFKSLEEKGVSVSVALSGGGFGVSAGGSVSTDTNSSNSEQNSKSSIDKDTVIIGGVTIFNPNKPSDFEKWAKSIKDNPMPIKGEYEPLSKILPTRLIKTYDEALEFYVYMNTTAEIQTVSNDDVKKIDMRSKLASADVLYAGGSGLQMIECAEKKSFILGFSMAIPENLEDLDQFNMVTCEGEQDKCFSKIGSSALYNYMFGVCSSENIPFLEQSVKTIKGQFLSLECSQKNQVILFGFGISILNSKEPIQIVMHPCMYGKRVCSIQGITESSQAALWIVCGHESSLNSKFATKVKQLHLGDLKNNKDREGSCASGSLFNLIFQFSNVGVGDRSNECFRASKGCIDSYNDTCTKYKKDKNFNMFSVSVF